MIFIYFSLEIYKKYGKEFAAAPDGPFNTTHCNIDLSIYDFINLMSVQYKKGHFILGAEFNETSNYEMYPDVGTETGVCKTIRPMVDFNPELPSLKDKDDARVILGSEVLSGESNGLTVILDVETFDHGYVPAKGLINVQSVPEKMFPCCWNVGIC